MNSNSIAFFNSNFSCDDWDSLLLGLGWKPTGNKNKHQYTRPGKESGVSGELINSDGTILLHSYSSNSGLPSKPSGKSTYSAADVIFGLNLTEWKTAITNQKSCNMNSAVRLCNSSRLPKKPETRFDFSDISKDFFLRDNIRFYRMAVNYHILNKNLCPRSKRQLNDYVVLNNRFENVILNTDQMIDTVGKGFAICPSKLKCINGHIKRNNDSWEMSELIIVDVDKGFRIQECLSNPLMQSLLFLYTTVNHSADAHRFRLVFALGYTEYNADRYKASVKALSEKLNGDSAATSISNSFYGNSNALILNKQKGAWYRFKDGARVSVDERGDVSGIISNSL